LKLDERRTVYNGNPSKPSRRHNSCDTGMTEDSIVVIGDMDDRKMGIMGGYVSYG
jgi:hypothetical protein